MYSNPLNVPDTPAGPRPEAAPIPPPGYYWVRVRYANVRRDGDGALVWFWESAPHEWTLVEVQAGGGYLCTGGEELGHWETPREVVVAVSPRVEPPA